MIRDINKIHTEMIKYKNITQCNQSNTKQHQIYKMRHGRLVQPREGNTQGYYSKDEQSMIVLKIKYTLVFGIISLILGVPPRY